MERPWGRAKWTAAALNYRRRERGTAFPGPVYPPYDSTPFCKMTTIA